MVGENTNTNHGVIKGKFPKLVNACIHHRISSILYGQH